MMIKLAKIVFLLSIIGCRADNKEGKTDSSTEMETTTAVDSTLTVKGDTSPSISVNDSQRQVGDLGMFKYEDDFLLQEIKVILLSSDSLDFKLTVTDKMSSSTSSIDGIALLNPGTEVDEDETGTAYMAKEFIYNETCWLSIRIDLKEKDKLKILEANCESLRLSDNPFASKEIMRIYD